MEEPHWTKLNHEAVGPPKAPGTSGIRQTMERPTNKWSETLRWGPPEKELLWLNDTGSTNSLGGFQDLLSKH